MAIYTISFSYLDSDTQNKNCHYIQLRSICLLIHSHSQHPMTLLQWGWNTGSMP